jgi:hypothetical protein
MAEEPLEADPRELVGTNLHAAPLKLLYGDLEREGDRVASVCPACKLGVLPVYLDPQTLRPKRRDRCLLCGQVVIYQDDQINGLPFHEDGDRSEGR